MAETIKGTCGTLKSVRGIFGEEMDKNITKAVKLTANEYKKDVQKVAPTRPVHTGDRSTLKCLAKSHSLELICHMPRRLEYGFADVDSLGRVYDQKAQPHFRPTFDENIEKYKKTFKEALFG